MSTRQDRPALPLLLAATGFKLCALAWLVAPAVSRPGYAATVQALVRGDPEFVFKGPWGYTLPPAYVGAVALPVGWFGTAGLHAANLVFHAAGIVLAFQLLQALACRPRLAALGAFALFCHPQLLLMVKRYDDMNLAIPLLLLALLAIPRSALAGGVASGALLATRPAMAGVLALWAWWSARNAGAARAAWRRTGLLAACALVTCLAIGLVIQRSPRPLPHQIAYNLFICSNPFSAQAILNEYSCEPSLEAALDLASRQHDLSAVKTLAQAESWFYRLAFDYLRANPGAASELIALKIYNVFRADLRPASRSVGLAHAVRQAIAFAIAFIPLLWTVTRVLARRARVTPPLPVIALTAAYLVPIALTQTEVRLRLPIDIMMLIDAIAVGCLLWQRRRDPSGML